MDKSVLSAPSYSEHSRTAARAHKIIAECSHVLVRASEERQLLQDMCRIVVDSGGYRVAWVGLVRHDEGRTIEPVASAGDRDNYLGSIKLSWADNEFGRGPAGMAVRTGKPQAVRDVRINPAFAAWRDKALARGFEVLAALPLICDGETLGVFGIFAGESTALDSGELELLGELARDIAYGMQTVRAREAQRRAEADLRESELRFQATFDQAAVGIARVDTQGRITLANRRLHEILGFEPGTLTGRTYKELSHPDDANASDAMRADLHSGKIENFSLEKRYLRKDGSTVWIWLTVSLMRGVDGLGEYEISVFQDVTANRRSELLLKLEHTVTRSLAESDNVSSAMKSVIRAVCESEGWECGRYLRVDEPAGVLRFSEFWSRPDPTLEQFIAGKREAVLGPGVGLAGKVWQSGQPLWSADTIHDQRALGSPGMRGAFLFPVVAEGKTLGVMSFNSREIREPDERLTRAVGVIGAQIGQFVQRKSTEETLRESETHYRALSELSADWYWEQDAQFRFTEISGHLGGEKQFRREVWFGKTRWELPYVGVSEDDWRAHRATLEAHRPFRDFVVASRRKDGSLQYVSTSGYPVFDGAGNFNGYRGIARDVSERKETEEKVRTQALQQRLIAEFGQQALANTDLDGVLGRAVELVSASLNAEYCNVLEMDPDGQRLRYKAAAGWPREWVGRREVPVRPGNHMEYILSRREPLVVEDYSAETRFSPSPLLQFGVRSSLQVPILRAAGVFGVLSVHTPQRRRFTEDEVSFLQSVANILAVAIERKNAEERLSYLAQFDSLTGLPNRHLFHDRLVHTMAQAKRNDRPMAVLFIDLDRFKLVNDTQGHGAGDQLLKESAARLAQCVRSSDTVGRFGGDEFGAIVSDLSKPADASLVAQKVIDALAQPFDLDGHETFISASVGITLFPGDGEEAGALITNADVAMYRAKEQGRNNYQYFTREMNERALERVRMEAELRRAIERREFLLHYQPKVDLKSGAICGLEALLRWQHPKKGLVSPAEFIPVLEDTGLIVPVGEWVMQEACTQVQAWRRAGLAVPPVAVNLSARQFQQKDLEAIVRRILQATAVDAALLELELTESMLMKDPEAAARTLQGLKEAGVKLSVDDFGTGYSSLAYLKRFPIDSLKIDRAFIRDVTLDPDDAAITLAIIGLGHSLKLKVVAEGVETEAQLDFLSAQDCDEMQGFYFARPLPVTDCTQALTEGRRLKIAAAKKPANAPRRSSETAAKVIRRPKSRRRRGKVAVC